MLSRAATFAQRYPDRKRDDPFVVKKQPPTDLRWRENPLLWVLVFVVAIIVALGVVLVTHPQSAQINCVPGYHVHHGKCVKD